MNHANFLRCNILLNVDSYKASHFLQYPPDMQAMFSYLESRGGRYPCTVFFGLQMLLKEYLMQPIDNEMIVQAKSFFQAHGEPFNEAGWRYILEQYQGYLPIRIRAVPEGLVVPAHHVLMTIECDDPQVYWLVSYLETMLLRIWYPITVATQSWYIRQTIAKFVQQTSDDVTQLPFKLHDFGARGVSSTESAAIGGAAHLVSFEGTDTVLGVMAANAFYGHPMAGFSIPAAEHSTVISWGETRELMAYRHIFRQFAQPNALVSIVSDSYDFFAALQKWCVELKEEVIRSGAMLVIRPDSGDPLQIVLKMLVILERAFGVTLNQKSYKVLNHVRIIQGDGINEQMVATILQALQAQGYAIDNIAFGMGGALLQQLNRDTQHFAMKCSAVKVAGKWQAVFKDPKTDVRKRSKKGRLTLLRHQETGEYRTVTLPLDAIYAQPIWQEVLIDVFENGKLLVEHHFEAIRARASRFDGIACFNQAVLK